MKKLFRFEITYLLMVIVAITITILSVYFKADPLKTFPLYVSLIIMVLNSRINRYGPLIGGINSIIYAIVYFQLKVYGTAFYSLFFSCPFQIITFIRWSKQKYKHSTILKTLSKKSRIIISSVFIGIWVMFYGVLSFLGSSHVLIDNTSTMLGILSSTLCMLSYSEYTYLAIPNITISTALQTSLIISGNPAQITYLIYDLFCAFCSVRAIITANNLLKEQKKK